jgi:hypothetical protein
MSVPILRCLVDCAAPATATILWLCGPTNLDRYHDPSTVAPMSLGATQVRGHGSRARPHRLAHGDLAGQSSVRCPTGSQRHGAHGGCRAASRNATGQTAQRFAGRREEPRHAAQTHEEPRHAAPPHGARPHGARPRAVRRSAVRRCAVPPVRRAAPRRAPPRVPGVPRLAYAAPVRMTRLPLRRAPQQAKCPVSTWQPPFCRCREVKSNVGGCRRVPCR